MPNSISYIELPSADIAQSKQFYGTLFGWTFEDFGPEYVAFHDAGVEGGFNATKGEDRPAAPLVVIETEDIEAMQAKVRQAGATITLAIFAYPGGRRFHFLDPFGNELAMMQPD